MADDNCIRKSPWMTFCNFAGLNALNCPRRQANASTSYTVPSRNRDQFLRIVGVHHSGRTPTAVDARHDYVGLDAMQSLVPPVNHASFDGDAGRTRTRNLPRPGEQGRSIPP